MRAILLAFFLPSAALAAGEATVDTQVASPFTRGITSPAGAFLHEIAIETPRGIGPAPALSLRYDSSAPSGLAGVGWSLGGLPAIVRVAGPNGVQLTSASSDRFAYAADGWSPGVLPRPVDALVAAPTIGANRFLRPINGVGPLLMFESMGTCGAGPCYWIARDGLGTTMYFGGEPSSNASPNNFTFPSTHWEPRDRRGVMVYALHAVVDAEGRRMEVVHTNDGSTIRPSRVRYNLLSGHSSYAVRFEYVPRTDRVTVPFAWGVLLSRVVIDGNCVGATCAELRFYGLTYETSYDSGRARLVDVNHGSPQGASELIARFRYSNTGPVEGVPSSMSAAYDNTVQDLDAPSADMNSDGFADRVLVRDTPRDGRSLRIGYGNSNGWLSTPSGPPPTLPTVNHAPHTYAIGDVDGDGYLDVVGAFLDPDGTHFPGTPAGQRRISVLISFGAYSGSANFTTGQARTIATSILGAEVTRFDIALKDNNGDGRDDLILRGNGPTPSNGGERVVFVEMLSSGQKNLNAFGTPRILHTSMGTGWTRQTHARFENIEALSGDFNGDGRGDVAWVFQAKSPPEGETDPVSGRIVLAVGLGTSTGVTSVSELLLLDPNAASLVNRSEFLGVDVGDFDGDGRDDIVGVGVKQSLPRAATAFVIRGASSLPFALVFQTAAEPVFMGDVQARDFDRDGRADFADGVYGRTVWGTGGALGALEDVTPPWDGNCSVGHSSGDLNGDGLLDRACGLLADGIEPGIAEFFASANGSRIFSGPSYRTAEPGQCTLGFGVPYSADINGDTRADPYGFRWDCDPFPGEFELVHRLSLASSAQADVPDLLIEVARGPANLPTARTLVSYRPSTTFSGAHSPNDTTCANGAGSLDGSTACGIGDPRPRMLVASVTETNGVDDPRTMSFTYQNGRVTNGGPWARRSLGFERVGVLHGDGRFVETVFAQALPFTGVVRSVSAYDGSARLMSRTDTEYQALAPYTGVSAVVPSARRSWEYEETTLTRDRQTTWTHDASTTLPTLARHQVLFSSTPGDNSAVEPRVTVRTEYLAHNTSTWTIARPSARIAFRERITDNVPLAWLGAERWTYGDASRPWRVTEVRALLLPSSEDGCGSAATTSACDALLAQDPSAGRWVTTFQSPSFDALGRIRFFEGVVTPASRHPQWIDYDARYGAYPSVVTNALNHSVGAGYDDEGRTLTITDENAQVTTLRRDGLGRVLGISRPGWAFEPLSREFMGDIVCPELPGVGCERIRVTERPSATESNVSELYLDGFGDVRRSERPHVRRNGALIEEQATIVETVWRGLDAATGERIERHAIPRYASSPAPFGVGPVAPIGSWEQRWDVRGRPTRVARLDASNVLARVATTYTYGTDGSASAIDGVGRETRALTSAYGAPIAVIDPAGVSAQYSADPAFRAAQVVVPSGAQPSFKTFSYDGWGRLLSAADAVTWSYAYDDASNLVSEAFFHLLAPTTAYEIARSYDALDRLTAEGAAGQPPLVSYYYDEPIVGRTTYNRGKLTRVGDPSGTGLAYDGGTTFTTLSTRLSYNARGELESREVGATGLPVVYRFNYAYDGLGRLSTLETPRGPNESAAVTRTYRYTSQGQLAEVQNGTQLTARWMQFDARGLPAEQGREPFTLLGTTFWPSREYYSYDADARLASRRVQGGGGRVVLDDTYTYDGAGGLTALADGRLSKTWVDGSTSILTDRSLSAFYEPSARLDRVTSPVTGTSDFVFDAQGTLVHDGGRSIADVACSGGSALDRCIEVRTGNPSVWTMTARHDAAGLRVREDWTGLMNVTFAYDRWRRVTNIAHSSILGTTANSFSYAFDGTIRRQVHAVSGAATLTIWDLGDGMEVRQSNLAPSSYATTRDVDGLSLVTSGSIPGQPTLADMRARQRRTYSGSSEDIPPAGTLMLHADRLGSSVLATFTRNVLQADGSEAIFLSYDAWGQLDRNRSSGRDVLRRKYTGHITTDASGDALTRTRAYDATTKRFTSWDDLVVAPTVGGFNRSAYVMGDALNFVDPTGQCPSGSSMTSVTFERPGSAPAAPRTSGWSISGAWGQLRGAFSAAVSSGVTDVVTSLSSFGTRDHGVWAGTGAAPRVGLSAQQSREYGAGGQVLGEGMFDAGEYYAGGGVVRRVAVARGAATAARPTPSVKVNLMDGFKRFVGSLTGGRVSTAPAPSSNVVYRSVDANGVVQYVGITNNLARRAAEHLAGKGIQIEKLMGGLPRDDARAVEQALIEIHGLGMTGTLLNRINSIAPSNPAYAAQVRRGYELLQSVGY